MAVSKFGARGDVYAALGLGFEAERVVAADYPWWETSGGIL